MKYTDNDTKAITNVETKKDTKDKLYIALIILIMAIGMLIRIVGIADMPNALNCDEASAGYEAFSILNYGIDRNRK